ncbi:MAG: alpha-N-arabinofuranosidase [Anaerolineae bacterium]|nr:alpha-N-arabinofuranosidase [Anaerolineae bacterium]
MTSTTARLTVQADQPKPISPDLFGIFFEDINYSADGGLYAELIQNRSFAYTSADNPDWNFFTGWELLPGSGTASIALGTDAPIHPNNPHYLALTIDGAVRLRNTGYDGIVINAGATYDVALFARTLNGNIGALTVRLEGRLGEVLGEAVLPAPTETWTKVTASMVATGSDQHGRFSVQVSGPGTVALDVISLFPRATFRNRPNGLRPDLAQVIADLKPRFIRFPGGCLVHGDGLGNMYRWKDTIGPIETRKEQFNLWNYHQSVGLGYFEYFQFCEDIGAKPLPVVPAGVCCPNTGARYNGLWEQGQCGIPLEEMDDYVQEVLDLIEWANGPVDSPWGAKRAAAGHPEPFHLEYLGVGNEDRITDVFKERFLLIANAVQAKYPEITVIGTVGPRPEGEDYDDGWQFARDYQLAMVDEHGYKSPDWFWDNLGRFDAYDRSVSTTVYLGEYAAHDIGRRSTLRSALAEAAYLTTLERNGDLVRLSSYAPLLGKQRRCQWEPDLIYFDNTNVYPTINYYVQQLFGVNAGESFLPTDLSYAEDKTLAASTVVESHTGDLILKIVSRAATPVELQIDLAGMANLQPEASCTVLSGEPLAENSYSFWHTHIVKPETRPLTVAPQFSYTVPAHSLSVIRIHTR